MQPEAAEAAIALLRTVGATLEEGLVAVGPAGEVLLLNLQAVEALGTPSESVGRDIHELGVDFRIVHALDRCLEHGQSARVEVPGRHLVAEIVPGEPPARALLVVRDQSQLRRLERMRSDFVTNVSHELRTPVTAIRLMVETLESGALQDSEAALGFVRRIGAETAHLSLMVEELLELSAIESGHLVIEKAPVPVQGLLDGVDRLRPLADAKSVALVIEDATAVPAVMGDATRLGQVLRNLVHNAIKFTPHGGTVTVSAAEAEDGVVLTCRDTGVGIAAADLPRIFERFWKADASRQRDGEGTGLGLSIARHIVELHGGTIRVESEPRHGATFAVELPLARTSQPITAS